MSCRHLKDPNRLSLFGTVLQKESRLFWIQMVERRKERPKPFEVSRYLSCIHRVAKEMNAIRSGELQFMKFCRAWEFVSQENFGCLRSLHLEIRTRGGPGPTAPRP